MKTLNTKYLIVVILIFTSSIIYSQTDTGFTFLTNDISIYCGKGSVKSISSETGKTTIEPNIQMIKDVRNLSVINDSNINISYYNKKYLQLNINKINSISIKSGSHSAIGILIGTISGGIIGALIGSTGETGSHSQFSGISTGYGCLIGILLGAISGGIIGGSIPSFESYDIGHVQFDKKGELERILKIDKKLNGM